MKRFSNAYVPHCNFFTIKWYQSGQREGERHGGRGKRKTNTRQTRTTGKWAHNWAQWARRVRQEKLLTIEQLIRSLLDLLFYWRFRFAFIKIVRCSSSGIARNDGIRLQSIFQAKLHRGTHTEELTQRSLQELKESIYGKNPQRNPQNNLRRVNHMKIIRNVHK